MKKLRMGVVGMGMGQGHARGFFSHSGADLVALCDIDAPRMQAVADEYGVTELYTDAETMFRKGGLDAVGIAVPNKFHAPLTIAALKQGLHVLCEKPMAMTVAEARRMNEVAAKTGLNLMIDFSHRFTAEAAALKRQIEAGVSATYTSDGPCGTATGASRGWVAGSASRRSPAAGRSSISAST